jgi:GrpB-like predicted nucleotidyltransferase (UPF0157 family)
MSAGLIVPHDPAWARAFATEAGALGAELGTLLVALHHIGSTAVPGLSAKPIIDMLGVVTGFDSLGPNRLAVLGYEGLGAYGIEGRRYFRKSTPAGVRTHHLHLYEPASPQVRRHLIFRDFLRANPDRANAYAEHKTGLAHRPDFQQAKVAFVTLLEAEAAIWAAGR